MNSKIDLKDTSFLIPTRIDSIDRLENVIEVVRFLLSNFDTQVYLLEADIYNKGILSSALPSEVNYTFTEDFDPIFHRTHYINQLTKSSSTPIISVWDSDVLVNPNQVKHAVESIRSGDFHFSFPYKRRFMDTLRILREEYFRTKDFSILEKNEDKMMPLYQPQPVGGSFFAFKQAYQDAGYENESFYGWGREDGERVNRWNTLAYKTKQIDGPLFHLTHSRGDNSQFHSDHQRLHKKEMLKRLCTMSQQELLAEINTWPWMEGEAKPNS